MNVHSLRRGVHLWDAELLVKSLCVAGRGSHTEVEFISGGLTA